PSGFDQTLRHRYRLPMKLPGADRRTSTEAALCPPLPLSPSPPLASSLDRVGRHRAAQRLSTTGCPRLPRRFVHLCFVADRMSLYLRRRPVSIANHLAGFRPTSVRRPFDRRLAFSRPCPRRQI